MGELVVRRSMCVRANICGRRSQLITTAPSLGASLCFGPAADESHIVILDLRT